MQYTTKTSPTKAPQQVNVGDLVLKFVDDSDPESTKRFVTMWKEKNRQMGYDVDMMTDPEVIEFFNSKKDVKTLPKKKEDKKKIEEGCAPEIGECPRCGLALQTIGDYMAKDGIDMKVSYDVGDEDVEPEDINEPNQDAIAALPQAPITLKVDADDEGDEEDEEEEEEATPPPFFVRTPPKPQGVIPPKQPSYLAATERLIG